MGISTWKRVFQSLTRFERILYSVSAVLLLSLTAAFGGSAIGLILCLFGLCATLLNTRGVGFCYYLYLLQAFLYGFVAVRNRFYGEAALNLLYAAPLYIRTIYLLHKGGQRGAAPLTDIRTLQAKHYALFAVFAAACIPAYGWALSLFGTALPYANAASACVYVAIIYLVSKRYIEQWMFWNVYTLIQFSMWVTTFSGGFENISIVTSNLVYLVLNTAAFISWLSLKRKMDADRP